MAIGKMEKIQILIHRDGQERLVERIQAFKELHITDIKDGETTERYPDLVSGLEVSDEDLERRLAEIQSTLDFLSSLGKKKGLFSGFVSPKIVLTRQQYQRVVDEYDERPTVSQCRKLDGERGELLSTHTKLEGIVRQLRPWLPLDCPLEQVASTEHTAIFLGTLPVESLRDFHEKSNEIGDQIVVEMVNQDRERAYLLICCHREIFPPLWDLLKRLGFEEATFSGLHGTPREAYRNTLDHIEENLQHIHEIEERSREYLKERQNLQIFYDHLDGHLQRSRIQSKFGQTEKASVIEGWLPRRRLRSFETTLKEEFNELAILPLDPSPREAPPIYLENSKTLVRPYEAVTELYGFPNAKEYDPSPLLAPFFFVFFGLCITDAAYGVMITLLFLYLMKRFKMTLGKTKLIGLLFFGGISTILMGAMTGGWFGDLADYLPLWLQGLRQIKRSLMLFDPMEQVLVFIGIALMLGFTQICFGLGIRLVRKIRGGDLAEALCGPLPWLFLLNGLVGFGLSRMGAFPPLVGSVGKWMAILAALAIIFLTDRASPSWFARVAWGVYGLYGITSYVGDVLSYLRLFALGLSTGIIAMVVNVLADMLRGAPYIGWLLFALIFVIGHVFNILVNGLGAFVHTLRLQYVEFFPKFFEGGGKPYRPFQKEARYTIVSEEGQG